ncbi:ABC transporter permease [Sanguibacter sp. A247]|uniref:ABC transporter permease n=1 Tax=unclassified Sanguibacter TaxID=2645534 RepID=UPI003FD820B2
MAKFILRRLGASLLVLLGGSMLLFFLVTISGDPIGDLRESNAENRDYLIRQRTEFMGLDTPWFQRYGVWLGGVAKCVTLSCDLGTNRNGVDVVSMLGNAASSTLRLVVLATVLAIVIGVIVGIVTAIRQYSGFDYVVTFLAFLFFSLPVFWAAVLLKEFGAIRFNDWIVEPTFTLGQIAITAVVLGVILQGILGGGVRRRAITAGATLVFVIAAMSYFSATEWFRRPLLGLGFVLLVGIGAAVGGTALFTGIRNRRVLYATLGTVAAGTVSHIVVLPMLTDGGWGTIFALLPVLLLVGGLIGWFVGGYSRKPATILSMSIAVIMGMLIVADVASRHWASFLGLKSRPISTIGSQTPNFAGGFWESFLDKGAQIILPTIILTLVSIASYTRYTRSSMLEVMNQDYIRTARSKGLSERVVIVKHGFRNALIPITTIVAFDFAGLIGGAVITEQVFGWKGMGELFQTGLKAVDPAPVMAFFLVTGTAAVVMNLVADLAYAALDPRIRR